MMYGIYKYENGLCFTGKIANSIEEAESYLGKRFGKVELVYTGNRDANGYPLYEDRFVPCFNENVYKILPLETV